MKKQNPKDKIIADQKRQIEELKLSLAKMEGRYETAKFLHEQVISRFGTLLHDGFRIAYKGKFI